jgi:DNA polymerase III alpha subunit
MGNLTQYFRRSLPQTPLYRARLKFEIGLAEKHKLEQMFVQVREILDLIPDIPHNIRGSAGSSLLCYLLGITSIDPVAWQIPVTRFMHELRPDAPDIDIDIPYNRRDEVFARIFKKYGNRAARVSNKVHIDGKFHHWSLHCGGLVIMDAPIPSSMLLKPYQLNMDKNDVEKAGLYKIDLLSSRSLAQLMELSDRPIFDYPRDDPQAAEVLASGKSIGIIGGESPAFRKAAVRIGVKRMEDAMLATSLIRPAAAEDKNNEDPLVYEDDVIVAIARACECSHETADLVRRALAKKSGTEVLGHDGQPILKDPSLRRRVEAFRAYAFCKSHGVAYGAVVWALAYHKARNPASFWRSTLTHAHSMYRSWVHPHEASPYADVRQPQRTLFPLTSLAEWENYGHWSSPDMVPGTHLLQIESTPGVWSFRGPIAASRLWYSDKDKQQRTFLTVGVAARKYINVTVPYNVPANLWNAVQGKATRSTDEDFQALFVQPVRRSDL